jgi:hypothetical protein
MCPLCDVGGEGEASSDGGPEAGARSEEQVRKEVGREGGREKREGGK